MKSFLRGSWLIAALATFALSAKAQTFTDNFNDGSRTDGSPALWTTQASSSTLAVVNDPVMGEALSNTSSSVYGTELPTTFTLTSTNTVTVSFNFRFSGTSAAQEIRLGLFNSGSTPFSTTDAAGSANTNDDQGIYLDLGQVFYDGTSYVTNYANPNGISIQLNEDGGSTGGLFFSANNSTMNDRVFGTTINTTSTGALGTTEHLAAMTIGESGSNFKITFSLDGTVIDTQLLVMSNSIVNMSSFLSGINELAVIDPGNTGASGATLLDNITVTAAPEPSTTALLVGSAGLLFLLAWRGVLRRV